MFLTRSATNLRKVIMYSTDRLNSIYIYIIYAIYNAGVTPDVVYTDRDCCGARVHGEDVQLHL